MASPSNDLRLHIGIVLRRSAPSTLWAGIARNPINRSASRFWLALSASYPRGQSEFITGGGGGRSQFG
jgi:hypothetical protein